MKRWHCAACAARGDAADWDDADHRTQSFCRGCGAPGERWHEYGCFQCDEAGFRFWGAAAPSHPCPQCGADAYRIVYAPALVGEQQRADYAAADAALVGELERQKVSTTTLKRAAPKRENPFAAHWADTSQVLPPGTHGVGGQLPFGMPRPATIVAGRDPRVAR